MYSKSEAVDKIIIAIAIVTCVFSAFIALFLVFNEMDASVFGISFAVSLFYLSVRGIYELIRWS